MTDEQLVAPLFSGEQVNEEEARRLSKEQLSQAVEQTGDVSAVKRDLQADVQATMDTLAQGADIAAKLMMTNPVLEPFVPGMELIAITLDFAAKANEAGLLFKVPEATQEQVRQVRRIFLDRATEDTLDHARRHGLKVDGLKPIILLPAAEKRNLPKEHKPIIDQMRSGRVGAHMAQMNQTRALWLHRHRALHSYYVKRMGPHFVYAFNAKADPQKVQRIQHDAFQHNVAVLTRMLQERR